MPAFLVIIACWPFTSLPFDVKTKMAHEIVNITEDYRLNFYWFTFEELLYGRSIHLIIYACASMIYFFWNKQILIKRYGVIPSNHYVIKRWFFTLVFLQVLIASMSLGHMITLYTQPFSFLGISSIQLFSEKHFFRICGGGFFIQNFFLFLFPKILYGNISYREGVEEETNFTKIKLSISKPLKSVQGDIDLNAMILPYLAESPFAKKDFTLSQMSFDLKIPERILSNYFNKELNKTFGEWKNDLRIEYAIQLIHEGNAKRLTIEAISTLSGFVSRSKFIDAFKIRKGMTPSVYIKENKFD
jgi:AraC-like DNA-binding protein